MIQSLIHLSHLKVRLSFHAIIANVSVGLYMFSKKLVIIIGKLSLRKHVLCKKDSDVLHVYRMLL